MAEADFRKGEQLFPPPDTSARVVGTAEDEHLCAGADPARESLQVHSETVRRRPQRVVQNLYSNAAKYAPRGSNVEMRFYKEVKENILCFFNSGKPIPETEKEELFEKYARLKNKHSQYSKGLGLFFCRMVMHAHKGRIWLDTDENGNYFKLAFPMKELVREHAGEENDLAYETPR